MRPRHPRFPVAPLAASLMLWACGGGDSSGVAGGSGTDAGNAFTVVALDPAGAPAARAQVEVWPAEFLPASEGALPTATGTTGLDGTARLRLPSGRWSIVVRKDGLAWMRIVAVEDTARDTLRPMASIKGEVLGGSGLVVSLRGLGRMVRCDPTGSFTFDSLPSGRHVLVVRSGGLELPRTLDLLPAETRFAILPSDTLRLLPGDTLEIADSTSSPPSAVASSEVGTTGPFALAARFRRVSIGDSATIFSWISTGSEALRLGWRGLDTLHLEVPGRSPIEIAGFPLDTTSHLIGIGWTSGTLGIWLDAELILSLSTQAFSDRSGWSSSLYWGSNGVATLEGLFHKMGEVPSDWFLQLSRSP